MSRISLEQANALIAAAFAKGQALGLKPLTVAVLNSGGCLIALQRQEGASNLPAADRHRQGQWRAGARRVVAQDRRDGGRAADFVASLGPIAEQGLIPAAGGIILVDGAGGPIGAVGITGDTSDNDETCALAGAAAAGLQVQ